ncbi:hypothetical protein [Labrenzia sp. 011]|uniref:hypothetical protein n=1 Tax=Labrenzia sp. 011 TaxID=2171494 RepID=UPI000D51F1E3|nr:hypothetical protein [Labrenzia sp. 011]PVB61029.1 hypothetical protein DCO57_13875 [Labrenzia sp. 011]
MADFTAKESITQNVSTEAEFNSAIANVNSNQTQVIDIVASFTLSADTTPLNKNAKIKSSTGSEIFDGGFSVLTVENGAKVTFGVRSKGTGMSNVFGPNGSALIGVQGGSLANVTADQGLFHVPSGEMFSAGGVSITNFAELKLGGRLFNEREVRVSSESIVTVESGEQDNSVQDSQVEQYNTAEPAMASLIMEYQSETFMTIPSDTVVILGKTTVDTLCQIQSDGTGTIWSNDTIEVSGNNFQDPGQIIGANVPKIELNNGGRFSGNISSTDPYGAFDGNTADTVTNTDGDFQMGTKGSCSVKHYKQTGGYLKFRIDNYEGHTSHLSILETLDVSGGVLEITAETYPDHPRSTVSTLITAPGPSSDLNKLAELVHFNSFPSNITPSLQVVGNELRLSLTAVAH